MIHRQTIPAVLLSALALATLAVTAPAGTNDIFRTRVLLRGAFQDTNDVTQVATIGRASLTGADLVNLARGRAITTPVPANEVLALLVDRDDKDRSVIVYDTAANSNLVTVAEIKRQGRVHRPGLTTFIWDIKSDPSGDETNGITDADFKVAGTRVRTNHTFVIQGEMIGTIDVNSAGRAFHIIVPSGRLAIKGPAIGQIID